MKTKAPPARKKAPIRWPGTRIGHLTVMDATDQRKNRYTVWRCRCDCGNICTVGQTKLQSGITRSCGCYAIEVLRQAQDYVDGTKINTLESILSGKLRKTNTSGRIGVNYHKSTGKWVAHITFQGKEHYLGEYLSKADAIKARERAEDMFRDFLRENGRDVPERDDGT